MLLSWVVQAAVFVLSVTGPSTPAPETTVNDAASVAESPVTPRSFDEVTVELASGRVLTAAVDRRSDDRRLWLRFEKDGASVLRPVEWTAVVSASTGDEPLDIAELRAAATQANEAVEETAPVAEDIATPAPSERARRGSVFVQSTSEAYFSSFDRMTAVHIDVELGHWDADVEADGLVVFVYPVNEFGDVMPVNGTVDIELIGMRRGPITQRENFPRIARWTRTVRAEDFGPHGIMLRLPFAAIHPEFSLDVAPHGLVHARFAAPGHGVFETTDSMVRIREYSSVRDRAQQVFDRRFLPTERTGRGHQTVRLGG